MCRRRLYSEAGIFCWEAATSGRKEQDRSSTVPVRGYRLRAKWGRQSRVLQRANRQVTVIAEAVVIAFFVTVALQPCRRNSNRFACKWQIISWIQIFLMMSAHCRRSSVKQFSIYSPHRHLRCRSINIQLSFSPKKRPNSKYDNPTI